MTRPEIIDQARNHSDALKEMRKVHRKLRDDDDALNQLHKEVTRDQKKCEKRERDLKMELDELEKQAEFRPLESPADLFYINKLTMEKEELDTEVTKLESDVNKAEKTVAELENELAKEIEVLRIIKKFDPKLVESKYGKLAHLII